MRSRACLMSGAAVVGLSAVPATALAALRPALLPADGALHGGRSAFVPASVSGPFAVCPVGTPRHYRDDFGEPRYGGGFHRHEGIDVFAPRGTQVLAPFDGTAKASSSWAGGLQVTLTGRGGFVFNAHLNRKAHMGRVRTGTVIGHVGNSGDARGGSTHDHFEWHPKGGPAVDPYRWLNAVCRPSHEASG